MVERHQALTLEYLEAELHNYPDLSIDLIGDWTVRKEQVLAAYLSAYNLILDNRKSDFHDRALFTRHYIDGFAGAGIHKMKRTLDIVAGSALLAVNAEPRFDSITLVELDQARSEFLTATLAQDKRVIVRRGDCNEVLPSVVFPEFTWKSYKRAVCFLDPYKVCLDWRTVLGAALAGKQDGGKGTVEVFINYPNHDIRRNMLRAKPELVSPRDEQRMTAFWGDDTWKGIVFTETPKQGQMFAEPGEQFRDATEQHLIDAYGERLTTHGGYPYVVGPFPFRNSVRARIFLLFFATNSETAAKAARGVFKKFGG